MKKRRVLKRWVKIALESIAIIVVMAGISSLLNKEYDNALNDCVNSGNNYNYCVRGLK